MTMPTPTGRAWRVGELAAATGLTVRALHHYEAIGLLPAPPRSDSGYRTYGHDDVERLYRIRALRDLGLSLDQIGTALDDPGADLSATVDDHLDDLDGRIGALQRQRREVHSVRRALADDRPISTTELLNLMEAMAMTTGTIEEHISILVYEDLDGAYDHLVDVFGLTPGDVSRDDSGRIVHAVLEAGTATVWLHPETEEHHLGSPRRAGVATAMTAVMVDDVDAHYRHAVEHGATITYEPVDQPYGYREYGARDPEGGVWAFMRRT